jgi:hypothetical protein
VSATTGVGIAIQLAAICGATDMLGSTLAPVTGLIQVSADAAEYAYPVSHHGPWSQAMRLLRIDRRG